MSPLLHSLIEQLQAIPTHQWHRTAVVFPSRRAGVAFRKLLAENLKKTVFAPNILTLPEWLCKETGWQIADTTQLQFDLYEAYQEYEANEPLESFLRWAPKVLSDFSEVDAYLLDANQVFGYLSQEKAIDLWSPETGQLDEYASKYLAFYSRLGGLYHRLREKSAMNQTAWQSLIARQLFDRCTEGRHQNAFDHYLFAGFNALNRAEAGLLKHWCKHASAQVLFEADQHYLREEHEAGLFLRSYLEDEYLQKNFYLGTNLYEGKSRITMVEALGNSAQVQMAGQQVRQWMDSGVEASEIVVVLANEQLLVPMLQALPESLPAINVSMGYPFAESHAFSLLKAWSNWIEPLAEGHNAYVPHLLSLLKHPFLQRNDWNLQVNQLLAAGKLWMDAQEAANWTQQLTEALGISGTVLAFRPAHWLDYWQKILQNSIKQTDKLQESMCLQAIVLLRKISIQLKRFEALNDWSIFKPFLIQLCRKEQVAFLGEPMQGLQLMGLLETRVLAFRYVIVVGMNEGNLPAAQNADGFITYTLRREFGLPGPREKEAVFAYHFYRLLQNAEEAVLICNSSTDDFGQGEPSRYLKQIQLEWSGASQGRLFKRNVSLPPAETSANQDIIIQKTPEIQAQVAHLLQQKLSPSALQLYITCPLKFYFGRILRLKPADDLLEELQANEIGEVLHEVLEDLYADFTGKVLTPQTLESLRPKAQLLLKDKLQTKFPQKDFSTGVNLLIAEVCKSYLDKYLELEAQWASNAELKIEKQELAMTGSLETKAGVITLFGKADRIDRMDGQLRIIDYKTGKFEANEMKLTSAEELLMPKKLKAFQLLAYTWLYRAQEAPSELPSVGILSFRIMREGPKMLEIQGSQMDEALNWFEQALQQIVEDLINPELPISQTTDHDLCKHCDFKGICNR